MRAVRVLSAVAVAVTALGLSVPLAAGSAAAAAAPVGLPPAAAAQIDAIAAAKSARTPAQAKVSSHLLTTSVQRAGGRVAAGVGPLTTGVTVEKDGTTRVTVAVANGADPQVVAKRVVSLGGTIRGVWKTTVDADLPVSAVTSLAGSAAVRRIDPTGRATLAGATPATAPSTAPATAPAAPAEPAPVAAPAAPTTGAIVSQGVAALGADVARTRYGVGGAGVTIGVLSDGVDSLAASIARGELPASTTVLDGQEGDGDEGTAMLEIVHDVAPTASLLFATAFTSAESFAQNIRDLRAAGADIIVDDIIYFDESPFQDGPIAQAVLDVTNDGALYFSSAGNQGNVDDGTSGNWEGDFVSSGLTIGKYAGFAHDFAPGAAVQASDPLSDDVSPRTPVTLFWADPLGAARDDYDLYVVDGTGNVVAASNDTQDGDDDPYERVDVPSGSDLRVAVVKYRGAARYLQVTSFGGRFEDNAGLTGYATPGVIRGHSAVPAAYSVAAVPAAAKFSGEIKPGLANPSGPFPGQYTKAQKSEVFTSDGPRRVFFAPDGRALTPGNTSASGGQVRNKPDLTSADGVATSVAGFSPFFGTSAAAPHAAATAALVLSGNPGITPAAVRTALTSSTIDIEAPGFDRDTGSGIAQVTRVLATTGATPQPIVTAGQPAVTPLGDGDAFLEPGETARVNIPLTNTGDGTAAGISITLTSPDATVAPKVKQVAPIAARRTTVVSFTVTVPATHAAGDAVALNAAIRFTGVLSPTSATFSLPVGQPTAPQVVSYVGPALPIPDDTPAGIDVPLTVAGVGTVSGVTFSIDGTDCTTATTVGISHTWDGDLIGTLVAPDGTRVTLFSRIGGTGENFCQTVFDDAATTPIATQTSTGAPFTGSYSPVQPLVTFRGTEGDGTWTFNLSDNASSDTGTLRAFSLSVAGYAS